MFARVYYSVVVFLFGLAVGSFDNVVIYRIPEGLSPLKPRSFCPGCGHPIAWYDNIPVLSFILLRAKCRHCGAPISPRYPLVELASGMLFLAVFASHSFRWTDELPAHLFLVTVTLIVSVIDLRHQIIPNRVIYPSLLLALLSAVVVSLVRGDLSYFIDKALGFAAGGIPLGLLAVALPRGMGMGDAKLAAFTGLVLGWRGQLVAFFLAFLAGSIAGVAVMASGRGDRKTRIPFGPFLSLGALASLFWWTSIWSWYVGLF